MMFISARQRTIIFWTLTGIATLIGIFHASSLKYVNDDCFISFRYAKNLVNGLGLVYNAGERVEGYTNFLWTLIIAGGMKLNLDPVPFSMWLGIGFYALNILLFAYLSWKFLPNITSGTSEQDLSNVTLDEKGNNLTSQKPSLFFLTIPLTSLALCLHHDFNAYATTGLETSMYTFFVCLGFALLLFANGWKRLVASGFVFVLAMMTRPDGVIFLAASCVYILFTKKKLIKTYLYFLAPSLLIFLPYWLWRYNYYGYFFPNTFYAKSGNLEYYSQGLEYTWLYFKTYYVFLSIGILALLYIWKTKKELTSTLVKKVWDSLHNDSHILQRILLCCLFIGIYSFFIIRVGGDFMFARFFIPITPILFILIETLLNRVSSRFVFLLVSIVIIATTYLRFDQFQQTPNVGYIADEAQFYPISSHEKTKEKGLILHKYFSVQPVRVAFWAGQLRLMYYADPPYALEASAGLTDPELAHQTLSERGRPGHEKKATFEYFYKKKIQFFFGASDPPPQGQFVLNAILFDNVVAKIISYDNKIMTSLATYPEIHFVHFPEYLDQYMAHIGELPPDRIPIDYSFFKLYYFNNNQDTLRQIAFENYFKSLEEKQIHN